MFNLKHLAAIILIALGLGLLGLDALVLLGLYYFGESVQAVTLANCFWYSIIGGILVIQGIRLWQKPNPPELKTDDDDERLSRDEKDTVKAVGCLKLVILILLALSVPVVFKWLVP